MLENIVAGILTAIGVGVFILWALTLYLLNESSKGAFQHRSKPWIVNKIERFWNVSA